MPIRSLIPWRREAPLAQPPEALRSIDREIDALHREMNRLFESYFGEGRLLPRLRSIEPALSGFVPAVEVREVDSKIEVSAELPGLSQGDLEVTLSPDATTLTLKGEKKVEREEKGEAYYECERTYGAFRRDVLLPAAVKADKVEAEFKNGLLRVTLHKTEEEAAGKPIPVQVKA